MAAGSKFFDDEFLIIQISTAQIAREIMHRWKPKMHILRYDDHKPYGIFGTFQFAGDFVPFMDTLSHAYQQPDGSYLPIVQPGTYTCVRGIHKLEDGIPFETFEITGVEGHSGLLFHPGNFQKDSKGCTLVGASRIRYDSNHDGQITEMDDEMITQSKVTFEAWMKRLNGVNSFMLQVI